MKNLREIPECARLIDEMCLELEKLLKPIGFDSGPHKRLRESYIKRIFEEADKYKKEHPEEFKD